MTVHAETIMGINLGIEYIDDEDLGHCILIDFIFFRFLLHWSDL